MIIHIVAFARMQDGRCAIGINGKLPWHVPKDLQFFKQNTKDKTIYMGSATFQSLLNYSKNDQILPGRHIVVISRFYHTLGKQYAHFNNVKFCSKQTLDENIITHSDTEFIIVGGEKLYSSYIPDIVIATEIYTKVDEADSFYPHKLLDELAVTKEFTHYSQQANVKYIIREYAKIKLV